MLLTSFCGTDDVRPTPKWHQRSKRTQMNKRETAFIPRRRYPANL
jgi:hypothetical protein